MKREFFRAITESDLSAAQKLTLRLACSNPRIWRAVREFVDEQSPMAGEKTNWLELILELLPELLAIIERILDLFKGED